MHWYRNGWDIDFILEQGLKYHATYFMPKHTWLPEAWMDKLAAFCRRLGYRFVLRQALYDTKPTRGGPFRFQAWIDNVGVAPIYRRYDVVLRLRQDERTILLPLSDLDIRTWMPGDTWIDQRVTIPPEVQPGYAELSIGLVDKKTGKSAVRFAVKEQFADGWVPLEGVVVQ